MKRFPSLLFLALFAVACSDKLSQPCGFDMEVTTVTPSRAIIRIEPENKDVWYTFTFTSEDDIYWQYKDEIHADGSLERYQQIYDAHAEFEHVSAASFTDMFCYRGSMTYKAKNLSAGMRHRILVFQVDPKTRLRVGDIHKIELETPAIEPSDISFDIRFEGTTVSITPSREGERYFWDYERTDLIESNYSYSNNTFLYNLLDMYWEYGFLDSMVSSGSITWNFATQDRDMIEGKQYSLSAVGVEKNGEFTTELTTVDFIYRKNGIEVLPQPDYGF